MGDVRFLPAYERVRDAADRARAIRSLKDHDVVEALAAASRDGDALLANVLATELLNRQRRAVRTSAIVTLAAAGMFVILGVLDLVELVDGREALAREIPVLVGVVIAAASALILVLYHFRARGEADVRFLKKSK